MIMRPDMSIEKTHSAWQTSSKKKHDVWITMAMTTSKKRGEKRKI